MKIVQVVSLEERVPPRKYGGTELVAYNVTQGLQAKGHDVYLLATGDSKSNAKLVPIIDKPIREMYSAQELPGWRDYWKMASVSKMITQINAIQPDVIHNHFAWRMMLFSDLIKFPMISTMHGPLSSKKECQTYQDFPDLNYISISDNQRKALPEVNWLKTVYNGIDVNSYEVKKKPGGEYFLFLGRTSPEKGLKEIIQMIKKTKHALKIAAKVDEVDQEYFKTHVKPFIDNSQIHFLGEVGHAQKAELLKNAAGLLLWLNWEEPFGLVVAEAMACGTPVIVNPRGSMPELVVDKKTGFLVTSLEEMAKALNQVHTIDPNHCRFRADTFFSVEAMVSGYEDAMKTAIEHYKLKR
ncbi:MAG: glycosyltransferase family 4 protein [Microgenomates group bacterium]